MHEVADWRHFHSEGGKRMRNALSVVACLLLSLCGGVAGVDTKPPYQHVYYLFVQPPFEGCGDCYVPMIVTRVPIGAKALASGGIENVLIITYERDSIWEIRSDSVLLNRDTVSLSERKLRWNGSRYRYQEVSKQEALRLLRNPMGTMPISRPLLSTNISRGPLIEKLINDLSKQP